MTKVFPFYTCSKVWLQCLKTDHMAYNPSSKYVVGTSSVHARTQYKLLGPRCAQPEKSSNSYNSGNIFQLMRGERGSKYHFKWAIIGPPAKRHLNGVMSFRWWVHHGCLNSLLSSFIYVIVSGCI